MNTILEKLKLYFRSNSREKIEEDWKKTEKYDKIGPTIDNFIDKSHLFCKLQTNDSLWKFKSLNNKTTKNPKFASDFF